MRGKLLTDASMGAREPLSSWIASSNVLCNENDMAFLQRVIVIQFKPLDASAVDVSKSSEVFQRWGAAKKVVSCLLPDLEDMSPNMESICSDVNPASPNAALLRAYLARSRSKKASSSARRCLSGN